MHERHLPLLRQRLREDRERAEGMENDAALVESVAKAAVAAADRIRKGGVLLVAGNGGSAAQAHHLEGELVFVNRVKDRRGIPCIALIGPSTMTAIGNDVGYDRTFECYVDAHSRFNPQNIFLGISTSGTSKNVVLAMKKAKEWGLLTIALVGERRSDVENAADHADFTLMVKSKDTPAIQQGHEVLLHLLTELLEEELKQ